MRLTDLENLKSDLVDLLNEILQPGNNVTLKKNPRLKEMRIGAITDHKAIVADDIKLIVSQTYQNSDTITFDYNNSRKILKAIVQDNTTLQRVRVGRNGINQSTRKEINFIEGTNITLTVTDNPTYDRVDVTINSSALGSEEMADYTTLIDEVNDGVLLVDGGGDPFINTIGNYVVRINYSQPVQAITVATGGGSTVTAEEVATAVWDRDLTIHTVANSSGKTLYDTLKKVKLALNLLFSK